MKIVIVTFAFLVTLAVMFTTSVDARSGCCSHHGGVCGCGCCDGTSLSQTCAPYYPECSSGSSTVNTAPVYLASTSTPIPTYTPRPTYTPIPTNTPTLKPTRRPTIKITSKMEVTPTKKLVKKVLKIQKPTLTPIPQKNFWQRLFGL
ncbi:MAG TPA: hypothetical protein VLF89_05955 [Candidatus Saccharimonadales bacterium]|nr:hypothetical protein [Candidatus Saccharimonadales bacterium]